MQWRMMRLPALSMIYGLYEQRLRSLGLLDRLDNEKSRRRKRFFNLAPQVSPNHQLKFMIASISLKADPIGGGCQTSRFVISAAAFF
jgi:hypothetical protein